MNRLEYKCHVENALPSFYTISPKDANKDIIFILKIIDIYPNLNTFASLSFQ